MKPEQQLNAFAAQVALILGSGLGAVTSSIRADFSVSYNQFAGLPLPQVPGHEGRIVCGELGGVRVLAACGRVHMYEGWTAAETTLLVRLLADAGIRHLVLCNAAGAVNPSLLPGSLMLISDHLNLTSCSPLHGSNRFLDLADAYSTRLRGLLTGAAEIEGITLPEGVYAAVPGPNYETPAEIRMLRLLGADAVGMSTVLETIQARERGIEVAGLSLISNAAAGSPGASLVHADVVERAASAADLLARLLTRAVPNFQK